MVWLSVAEARIFVRPVDEAPSIVPPDQLSVPETSTSPAPPSAPLERSSWAIDARLDPPMSRVPPLICTPPVPWRLLIVAVPLDRIASAPAPASSTQTSSVDAGAPAGD